MYTSDDLYYYNMRVDPGTGCEIGKRIALATRLPIDDHSYHVIDAACNFLKFKHRRGENNELILDNEQLNNEHITFSEVRRCIAAIVKYHFNPYILGWVAFNSNLHMKEF